MDKILQGMESLIWGLIENGNIEGDEVSVGYEDGDFFCLIEKDGRKVADFSFNPETERLR